MDPESIHHSKLERKKMAEKFGKPKIKKLSKRESLDNWRRKEAARAKAKAIANKPQSRP
jgi:hypothetical protein